MYQWIRSLFGQRQRQVSQALPAATLQAIALELKQSPFLQQNILNQRFASTLGFSVLFSDPSRVLLDFPYLEPFLENLDLTASNFFYLNALVLHKSSQVDRHIDHSIRGYGTDLPFPRQVSILYLQIPEDMQGGRLLLYNRRDQISQEIQPKNGLLLHLNGLQKHAIEAILESDQARISLVCEQYLLTAEQLKCLPEYSIKSTANFEAFLQKQIDQEMDRA